MILEKRVRLLNGFLSVVIALMLIMGGLSIFAETTETESETSETNVEEVTAEGEYNSLTWVVYGKSKLVISGSGAIEALNEEDELDTTELPWNKYKDDIKTLIIEKGITEIGEGVFSGYGFITTISLGPDIQKIGKESFKSCTSIKSILIPANVTEIGEAAFSDCTALKSVYYASDANDWDKISIGSNNNYLTKATKVDTSDSSFGMFDVLNVPVGYILKFSYMVGRNYAVALFIFAIIMKIILFPLGIKQQKSMQKQAAFKPKEMAIRNKYKGRTDKASQQKMQQEIMEMQQKEGVSMFGGCLPLLIQLPVILVLFSVIRNPLKYLSRLSEGTIDVIRQRASDLGFNTGNTRDDLSLVRVMRDNFGSFSDIKGMDGKISEAAELPSFTVFKGFDLSLTPEIASWLVVIPILIFVSMFLTSKLNRKLTYQPTAAADAGKSMIIMDVAMPLMSVFFSFQFPAIIGVYWIYQNIVGTVQQLILKYMYPLPKFTEEDYKKAELELHGKTDRKKKKTQSAARHDEQGEDKESSNVKKKRNPKSLHYIDDDDDSTEEPQKPVKKDTSSKKKGKPMIGTAQMKKYDNKKTDKDETDDFKDFELYEKIDEDDE